MATNHELKVQVFNQAFDNAVKIDYDHRWEDSAGYFGKLCDPVLIKAYSEGAMCATTDDFGRKIIIIGTYFGPVAVFERYSKAAVGEEVYVYSAPQLLVRAQFLSTTGAIDLQTIQELLGHHDHNEPRNIGTRIKDLQTMADQVAIYRVQAGINASRERKARMSENEVRQQ